MMTVKILSCFGFSVYFESMATMMYSKCNIQVPGFNFKLILCDINPHAFMKHYEINFDLYTTSLTTWQNHWHTRSSSRSLGRVQYLTSQVVQKKKGCHKTERNSQKSRSRNSIGCKAIASSMPKTKNKIHRCWSRNHNKNDKERHRKPLQQEISNSRKKNWSVRSIKVENTTMLNWRHIEKPLQWKGCEHKNKIGSTRTASKQKPQSRNRNGSASKKNPQRQQCRHKWSTSTDDAQKQREGIMKAWQDLKQIKKKKKKHRQIM